MLETSCGYLFKEHQVLMLLRNKKKNDVNHGKWIGVGGKREGSESMAECMRREFKEETGLDVAHLLLRGILYFSYPNDPPEKIYIYSSSEFTGTMKECIEGTLQWIDEDKVLSLDLWEGDRIFLKKLLQDTKEQFCYHLQYDSEGKLLRAEEEVD